MAQITVYTNASGFVFDVFYATNAANNGGNTGDIDVELVAVPEPGPGPRCLEASGC